MDPGDPIPETEALPSHCTTAIPIGRCSVSPGLCERRVESAVFQKLILLIQRTPTAILQEMMAPENTVWEMQ